MPVGMWLVIAVVALALGFQAWVRWKAGRLTGQPLPEVPGPLGQTLRNAEGALVYFFSPSCAACRAVTPRIQAAAARNKSVFLINVAEQLEVARALGVMATPSTIELAKGRVVGVHIGSPPAVLLQRFG